MTFAYIYNIYIYIACHRLGYVAGHPATRTSTRSAQQGPLAQEVQVQRQVPWEERLGAETKTRDETVPRSTRFGRDVGLPGRDVVAVADV